MQGTATTYTNDPVPAWPCQPAPRPTTTPRRRSARPIVGHSVFKEHDYLYDLKINMHLFPNWYNGGIDFAAGYEHRNLHQQSIPDPVQAAGDQLGFNQAPNTKTTQEVDSFFTELNFPIVTSTMNVPFVRSFEIAIAWRYEKFEHARSTTRNSRRASTT